MRVPAAPDGYHVAHHVLADRPDCHITVGFDSAAGHIPCFLVQLHYRTSTGPVRWQQIARMDHHEATIHGHDVYREGLHVDVTRRSRPTVHLSLSHGPLPESRGALIRRCVEYVDEELQYFVADFEERRPPGSPPEWSDGGTSGPGFIRHGTVASAMREDGTIDAADVDILSTSELSAVLAAAEGIEVASVERGAEELEIAPPSEATVLEE